MPPANPTRSNTEQITRSSVPVRMRVVTWENPVSRVLPLPLGTGPSSAGEARERHDDVPHCQGAEDQTQ
jgi:hypothetical protein